MVVVGKHCYILRWTGQNANVSPFTPDYKALQQVPIVDAAILYEDQVSGKEYLLVMRNALHVKAMNNNLIPPFILREAGITVNDVPKIQVNDPTVEDHALVFKDGELRIPLSLWGMFSYFPSRKPTLEQVRQCEDVYILTPDSDQWDPHTDVYARNEENMVDWEGNMIEKQHRRQILLSDVPEDIDMSAAAVISAVETSAIDSNLERLGDAWLDHDTPDDRVSHIDDPQALCNALSARATDSHFMTSIGATSAFNHDCLVEEGDTVIDGDDVDLDELLTDSANLLDGQLDFDEVMQSATHARITRDVTPEHLSKIWKIDLDTAKRTLEVTSQHCARTPPEDLSRNYSTNDRMLRYRRIKEHFFMDTFYATKKAGKSTRGNTCCQLFVTDKGFVYVVPMKKESEILHAIKQFAKAIGAPETIIADAAKAQKSEAVRKFCNEIGTTLRILEEGTPWANKAELYIGLIKEAVRKDMKSSNCPLAFWDYCVERRARVNNLTARDMFSLHGSNPHTSLTGDEGDISNLCRFDWYEWCYYREQGNAFPYHKEILGRVLGPASGEGNEMAQWILKANGNVIPRGSARPLTIAETHSSSEINKRKTFDKLIKGEMGDIDESANS